MTTEKSINKNQRLVRETFPVGPLQCNCSILGDPVSGQAIVVDPGGDASTILDRLKKHNLRVTNIIHTHAHFDHCMATAEISANFPGAVVRLHEEDLFMYRMLAQQGRLFGIPVEGDVRSIDDYLNDDQTIELGSEHKLRVLHTPGHSPGSCCFELNDHDNFLFAGDTLFAGGIGRTDLWGGDHDQIMKSIRQKLFQLDRETHVIPGHGPATQIEVEKATNPFLA